jgi:predicted nucleic acid-binding protein
MSYLLDTNIVSEINRQTPNSGVLQWFDDTEETDLFISVITMGEIRRGIEQIRRRNQMDDERRAARLEQALNALRNDYRGRFIPISEEIAEEWGRMCAVYPNHPVDNLLSATARVHDMTLVTRNIRDVEIHNISCLNPFV